MHLLWKIYNSANCWLWHYKPINPSSKGVIMTIWQGKYIEKDVIFSLKDAPFRYWKRSSAH